MSGTVLGTWEITRNKRDEIFVLGDLTNNTKQTKAQSFQVVVSAEKGREGSVVGGGCLCR